MRYGARQMTLLQILARLRPYVSPYRLHLLGLIALTLAGAGAAQINALVLRHAVDSIEALLRAPRDAVAERDLLLQITVILAAKELLTVLVRYGQSTLGESLRVGLSSRLAQAAVAKLLTYRYAFFAEDDNAPGRLQTRIDRGADSLTRLVQNFCVDLLPLFASALLALGLMFAASYQVGLVAAVVTPLYFVLSYYQAGLLKGARYGLRRLRESKTQGLFNLIDSILVIKSFVREEQERQRQFALQDRLTDAQLKLRRTNYLFDALKSFAEQIGVTLVILLTAYLVLDAKMSLGAIMLHVLLFNNVSAPVRQLHRIYDEVNEALTYADGYFDVLDADAIEPLGARALPTLHGAFGLRHVSFTYPNGTTALDDVSFDLRPGEVTALVGLSGAGKSTLMHLLCKFHEPSAGTIELDGQPLAELDSHALRQQIGLVLQKNHIFRGSIEDNIRYGAPEASDEAVHLAAERAHLHEAVLRLPDGYRSDAQALSGGQQQRIAIARLFLKDPKIVFLDEPTASLDAIATEQIKGSLDAIKRDRTVLVISHSLAQILDADRVVVLQHGRVVEQGTHEELYARGGPYAEIVGASARSLNLERLTR